MSYKNFELLFFMDIFEILRKNRSKLKNVNQEAIMECFQVGFDSCW